MKEKFQGKGLGFVKKKKERSYFYFKQVNKFLTKI